MSDAFEGFPPEAFRFFTDLADHNDREWFTEHKHVYEAACRDPMKRLVAELATHPDEAKLSRINRDMRFQPNRPPYKTYIAAGFDGSYVSLSAEGVFVASGIYAPEPPMLKRYREAVVDDRKGRGLASVLATLRRKGFEIGTHEETKRVPRGFDPGHPRADLLRMKGIYAARTFAPAAWRSAGKAYGQLRKAVADLAPMRGWIRENVGAHGR